MVDVEPVGGEEHGEEKDNKRLETKSFPETPKLTLPGWVLHENDAGAVLADDIAGIAKGKSEKSTKEHEDNKPNVRSIADGLVFLDVDVFTEGNLKQVSMSRGGTGIR